MDFRVGDKAIYRVHGVGEITSIERKDIAGNKKQFYIVKISESGMKVMVPTDAPERAGLRAVITSAEASKVLKVLKEDGIAVTAQPWNRRHREYKEMMNSGSPFEVAKVMRDLVRLQDNKELSSTERSLLEQARNLLVSELALARECDEQSVEQDIVDILGPAASEERNSEV